MKTANGLAGKKHRQRKDGPRVTFCITREIQTKISALPLLEKRQLPARARVMLNALLDDWNRKHPQPNGKPLKLTP